MYIAQNSVQKSFKLQKVVNDSRKSGRGLIMLKVDFKTAYDSVNWEGIFGDVEAMDLYLPSIFKNSSAGKWYLNGQIQYSTRIDARIPIITFSIPHCCRRVKCD